ncbi:MAG TPA: protein kinase, partial [Blastocatellia bacterium]|nr:protein kinase [Blastocatellia bacterium]
EVDARSDVYSLGVVLYEMVTGQKPFSGRTPTEIALKQIQEEPIPPRELCPELPANLERVILRALAKHPAERQQSAEQFAEELQSGGRIVVPFQSLQSSAAAAEAVNVENENEALAKRLQLVRRRRRRVALATAALLLVGATTGVLLGRDWLASRLVESPLVSLANFGAQPSPSPSVSPENLNSDPDALELAAQLPADSVANSTANKSAQPSPNTYVTTATPNTPTPTPAPAPATKPVVLPSATPAAVKPAPTPAQTVTASRTPQPITPPTADKSEVAQAPHKTEDRTNPRADKNRQYGNPPEDSYHNDSPPVARRDRIATTRRNDEDNVRRESKARRQEPPNTSANRDTDDDPQDREDSQSIGPKLIQWSGSVNHEREVVIELPGKPGKLEIPRVYRNRVGMVEPPSPSNRWRCAKLRVLGQGGVSFVVRWWPEIVNLSRLGGR